LRNATGIEQPFLHKRRGAGSGSGSQEKLRKGTTFERSCGPRFYVRAFLADREKLREVRGGGGGKQSGTEKGI